MKSISVTEFRQNIRKYADLAQSERVIVNRGMGKSFLIIPVEDVEEEYNPAFVRRVLKAKKSVESGNYTEINMDNIWESIG